jgi:hypothetical protein
MNISEEITLGRMKASYEVGNIRGKHDAEKQARTEAFGAIRRAAEVARYHDAKAQAEKEAHPDQWHYCEWDYYLHDEARNAIRAAIRAAIGSDKP